MKGRQFKLALFLLLGAIVAFPLGIALDAIFPIPTRYHPHYSDSIGLWLVGEGADQRISDEPGDDPTGYVFFVCRRFPKDMSPIFPTRMHEYRLLHITLSHPSEQELWGKQCDPWRPMLAEYLRGNGYDSSYLEGVLLPDVSRDRTIWIAVWANGLVAVVVLFGIWPGSHRLVVWRIRLNRERKGCCPMCAYDLRGTSGGDSSAGCPECGWRRESEA